MATQEQRFQLAMMEAAQAQLRAQYQAKRIETGVWKDRIGKVKQGGLNGPAVPEADLLKDEVQLMHRHIALAQEHIEHGKSVMWEDTPT